MNCVVLDLETTGLSARRDKITEVAIAKLENNQIVDTFQTLVNPQMHIPSFITKLTGISDGMVRDAPKFGEILSKLSKFLGNQVMVAHNATFDAGFLYYHMNKHDTTFVNPSLCTRKLANRIHPDLPRKTLASLCEFYKVKNTQAHRAMSDVMVTVDILKCMHKRLIPKGFKTINDLLSFERLPRYKAVRILEE